MKQTGLFITAGIIVMGLVIGMMYFTITNTEIKMRETTIAQQEVGKANFDKMFKVISQTAQVPQKFMKDAKDAFKEIYQPLMESRYSGERGGALMSWVQENNPNFDLSGAADMYKQLQRVIEANRQEFFIEQKKLIDLKRNHSSYIKVFPNRLFLSDVSEIEIKIITSDKTEKVFDTGKEDDIDLF